MFPKYSFSHRSLLKSNNQQNLSHIRFFALQLYLGFWFNCNLRTDRQRLYENLETSYNCTIVPNFYIPTKIIIRTFHHWGTFITKLGYHRDTEIILKLLSQRRQQLPSRTIGSLTSIRRESRDYAGSLESTGRLETWRQTLTNHEKFVFCTQPDTRTVKIKTVLYKFHRFSCDAK